MNEVTAEFCKIASYSKAFVNTVNEREKMQENTVEKNMLKLESTHIYWHLEAE